METIRLLGADVKYIIEDSDNQIILFIHGYESSSKFIDTLWNKKRSYGIAAIDLPGNGESHYDKEVSIEFYVEIVKQFIEKLNLDNVILLGHSMGGAVAAYLAKEDNIKMSILFNPLNPYAYTSMMQGSTPREMLKDIIKSDKGSVPKMIRGMMSMAKRYRIINRFLVSKQFLDSKWQKSYLYDAYKQGSNKIKGIVSDNDYIIVKDSIDKTSKEFNIDFITLNGARHSLIEINTNQFNDIIESMIK